MTIRDDLVAVWGPAQEQYEVHSTETLVRAQASALDLQEVFAAEQAIFAPVRAVVAALDPLYVRRLASALQTVIVRAPPTDVALQYAAMSSKTATEIVVRANEVLFDRAAQLLADNNLPSLDQSWE